jgi:hypothetical protein
MSSPGNPTNFTGGPFGNVPVVTAGAGAGTSPTVGVGAGSDDQRGVINVTAGTSPAAGILCTVAFNKIWQVPPNVMITEGTVASAALNPAITAVSTTGFTLSSALPTAAAVYSFYYQVQA